jgi:7,8-dihydro-6-hydroxymethylpterin dimethyltransferase
MLDFADTRTVLKQTTSLCRTCRQAVPAEVFERDGRIFMHKLCERHGEEEVLLASDAAWYHTTLAYDAVKKPPSGALQPVRNGCPFDCGTCESHEQSVYLPVVPITSACNLDCPICYTINKNEGAYHMQPDEFARVLEGIRRHDPAMKIINLTGGEPTQHPDLPGIVAQCHDAGFHRVTISTHGLAFIHDESLLEALARSKARIVLSFNSFDEETNRRMLGANVFKAKLKVLERLEQHDVDTTLIPVIGLGQNDHEIGDLIRFAFGKRFIRSLEIHTMTFTGQGGREFEASARITTPDVLRRIEQQTGDAVRVSDFVPSPCAHPLCYQTCYLLETEDAGLVPFARFMPAATIRELLTDNLYMEPGPRMERLLAGVIDELWAKEAPSAVDGAVMATLKRLLQRMFPPGGLPYAEQQVIAERSAKAIYIHSHMDEANFDSDRIRQCCVAVPHADGRTIPTCSYNILYRERDPHFAERPRESLVRFVDGRTWRR